MRRGAATLAFFVLVSSNPAKAEVTDCKVIASLPVTIDAPGIWCLKKDLSWNKKSGKAVSIQRSFVTLDLNGFKIDGLGAGTDTQAVGISSNNRRSVAIRNGTIRGFYQGIRIVGTGGGYVFENLRLEQNRGIAIELRGNGNIVRNNHVLNSGGSAGEFDNNVAIQVFEAQNTTIADNVISGTRANFGAYGISVSNSDLTEIRNNSVLDTYGGQTGYAILSSGSTSTSVLSNRILNGAALGNFSIVGQGGSGINCINNIVARFANPITGCTFGSGNLTP